MLFQSQDKKKVEEAKLDEDDLIVIPGRSMKRKTGFVKNGESRVDHEVAMARSDLVACYKNAKAIFELLKSRTEEEGLEGWVQEKLIKASDYLNAVKEYYDEQMMREAGVIASGGVGEDIEEGVKITPDMIAKMNKQYQDFYKKNPHMTTGKEIQTMAPGAMATKVTPTLNKPAPVKKKPMTQIGRAHV